MTDYITRVGNKKVLKQTIQSSSGAADADKVISTDGDGFIDPSFLRDTEVFDREASENIASRDAVNIFDDAGTAKARKADASAFSTRATGFVVVGVLVTETARIISEGKIGGFAGLTIGDPVFLSASVPGGITQTPPTGAGEVWQKLGDATSATEIRIEIGEAIELT